MEILDAIVALLSEHAAGNVVGIEGLPYAGKTTLVNQLARLHGLEVVPEHTDFDPRLKTLAQSTWPTDVTSMLARQRRFLETEVHRSRAANLAARSGRGAIMDRTIVSLIGYFYVRSFGCPGVNHALEDFLEECAKLLGQEKILFPRLLLVISTPPHVVKDRALRARSDGDTRDTELFLLRCDVLRDLDKYHHYLAKRLPQRVILDSGDGGGRSFIG